MHAYAWQEEVLERKLEQFVAHIQFETLLGRAPPLSGAAPTPPFPTQPSTTTPTTLPPSWPPRLPALHAPAAALAF